MARITASAPILLVEDVSVSASWYRDKLGFYEVELYGSPVNFAIVRRDGHAVMFQQANPAVIIPNWKVAPKTSNVFFWVDDANALYEEFVRRGATIDYEPYIAPWGGLEFGINDSDGYDISFAQILKLTD